jgi:hypothetical protein
MEKTFTINVPDQLWVDDWSNNKTETYTYTGPEKLYVLINDKTDSIILYSTEEIVIPEESNDFVIEVNANEDTNVPVAHYLISKGADHEYTYEDEINYDGSIHKKITNPLISDYFDLNYDRALNLTLAAIYKNPITIAEEKAKERLKYVKSYDDVYDFDESVQSIIDTFLTNMNNYLTTMSTVYPWKHIEIDETEIPRVPASLITIFAALPEIS